MPPTIPINHYFSPSNQQRRQKSYSIIPCKCIPAQACLKHSNFLKVKYLSPKPVNEYQEALTEGWKSDSAQASADIITLPEIQLRAF